MPFGRVEQFAEIDNGAGQPGSRSGDDTVSLAGAQRFEGSCVSVPSTGRAARLDIFLVADECPVAVAAFSLDRLPLGL